MGKRIIITDRDFAEWVRMDRAKGKLTQDEYGKALGVDGSTVGGWERGSVPSPKARDKIFRVLGLRIIPTETTPMKAIRAKCLDCSCGSSEEVKICPVLDCPLYPYRSGHNPKDASRKGQGNPNFGTMMKERKAREQSRVETRETREETRASD